MIGGSEMQELHNKAEQLQEDIAYLEGEISISKNELANIILEIENYGGAV